MKRMPTYGVIEFGREATWQEQDKLLRPLGDLGELDSNFATCAVVKTTALGLDGSRDAAILGQKFKAKGLESLWCGSFEAAISIAVDNDRLAALEIRDNP